MRTVVVVVVLPSRSFLLKVDVVADPALVEQPVELLVVGTVRALDLAVEPGRHRTDVHVTDVDLVRKVDRGVLVAGVVDLEHPDACAVIDGRELGTGASSSRDTLEELHVHLQPVALQRPFVTLPALPVRLML